MTEARYHETSTRRFYMLATALVCMQTGMLDSARLEIPKPGESALAGIMWLLGVITLFLPLAAGVLALISAVARRADRMALTARLDSIWRAIGITAIVCWIGLGTWVSAEILLGVGPQVARLTVFFANSMPGFALLAASTLSPRAPYMVPWASPIVLVATSTRTGAGLASGWQPTLFFLVFSFFLAYFMGWALERSIRLDRSAARLYQKTTQYAAMRTGTVAKRRSEDFVHDDVLSTLNLVGKGHLSESQAAELAHALSTRLRATDDTNQIKSASLLAARLTEALAEHANQVTFKATVVVDRELPVVVAQALQAAVLQAVQNSLEHAAPAGQEVNRTVELVCDKHSLRLRVSDDGVGFDPTTTHNRHGLANSILRRAHDAGVDVTLRTAPGVGTQVRFELLPVDGALTNPLEQSLGLRPAVYGGISLLLYNVFCLGLYWDTFSIPGISLASFLLLVGAITLFMRAGFVKLDTKSALTLTALAVAADVLQSLFMVAAPKTPNWDHWATGTVTLLFCMLVLLRYAKVAWIGMAIISTATVLGVIINSTAWRALVDFEAGHFALMTIWTLTVLGVERTTRKIDAQHRQAREIQMWMQIEESTSAALQATRREVEARIRPLIEEVMAGGAAKKWVRLEAVLLEAELRDEIRAACFTGTAVPATTRSLRATGAEVVLLDDSSGRLSPTELEEIETAVLPVLIELIDAANAANEGVGSASSAGNLDPAPEDHSVPSGAVKVVVRVPPVTRREMVQVTADGQLLIALTRPRPTVPVGAPAPAPQQPQARQG
ncbi:MAG: hypothetical protein Q3999_05940 [Buchananella hordeovulneris]|nr:hypothetical protein [Buchananella hordeovulneris]